MKQSVTLALDQFARTTLESEAERYGVALDALLRQAVYYYLSDRESDRRVWRYPRFRRDKPTEAVAFDIVVEVGDTAWRHFQEEAEAQRVPVERLLEHAALYFVADLNSGRVAARILADD